MGEHSLVMEADARVDAQRWKVRVSAVGKHWHVEPVQGYTHLYLGGSYGRTEWRLKRAIRKWERWCDKENAAEARVKVLVGGETDGG